MSKEISIASYKIGIEHGITNIFGSYTIQVGLQGRSEKQFLEEMDGVV